VLPRAGSYRVAVDVELRWTTELVACDYQEMAGLFDGEYASGWGPWTPKGGYGYARGELHALVRARGLLVGYGATGRRFVSVGGVEVVVAGTGGVITRADCRGRGMGRSVLAALAEASRTWAAADFSLLGCRAEVVGFYESCGFVRVANPVRDISPRDGASVVQGQGPTLVSPGTKSMGEWPEGLVDLRGLPW